MFADSVARSPNIVNQGIKLIASYAALLVL
jgi:hypothetical protein